MKLRAQQGGLALITAMLVVAIVATIAAYLSLGQQVWLRQVQNLVDRSQANSMRHAALDFIGALLLRQDTNNIDHLGEIWATGLPPLPYEGGVITAQITDAQSFFNLNSIVRNNAASVPDRDVFKRLLQSLKLSPDLSEALIDWIDNNQQTIASGAEDVEYLASTRPYRTADQTLTSVDELRLIKGFEPEIVEQLRPFVTVLPQATAINVNTAQEKVLEALFNLPAGAAKALVDTRKTKPFDDQAELQNALPPGQQIQPSLIDYKTSYFQVTLSVQYGRWQRTTVGLINRQAGGQQPGQGSSKVLWHQPLYPKLPTNGEDEQT